MIYRIKPSVYCSLVRKRLPDPLPKFSGTHGGLAAVKNAQQRTVNIFVEKRFRKFQILYAGLVQAHAFGIVYDLKRLEVRNVLFLRILKVSKKHTGSAFIVT